MSLYIAKVGVEHVAYYTGSTRSQVGAGVGNGGAGAAPPRAAAGGSRGGGGGHCGGGRGHAETSPTPAPAAGNGEPAGVVAPAVGYYTGDRGELPGRWVAAGAMGVTEGGAVTPKQLTDSLSAVDPASGAQLGRRYKPGGTFVDKGGVERRRRTFSAYDMVYSPPKSVSAAWALADSSDRKEIEQAFETSTQAVVSFIQSEAVASRAGRNGVERVEVPQGATIARFGHWTSRAGDPHVHAHLIVHNRVRCEDDKWRTLDGQLLYKNAAAAAAVGAAVLRAELSQRLAWSWDRIGDNWHADLAGRPDDLIEEWSARHRQIAKVAQAKVRDFERKYKREPTPTERLALWDAAKRHTRQPKQTYGDHHARWRAEAEALGADPDRLAADLRGAQRQEPGRYDRAEVLLADRRQQLPDTMGPDTPHPPDHR